MIASLYQRGSVALESFFTCLCLSLGLLRHIGCSALRIAFMASQFGIRALEPPMAATRHSSAHPSTYSSYRSADPLQQSFPATAAPAHPSSDPAMPSALSPDQD